MLDVAKFVSELHEYFDRAIGPIAKRLKALEDRAPVVVKGEPGLNGKDGADGRDGASATDEQVFAAVDRYQKANPPPKGERGEPGQNGKDGRDGSSATDEQILFAVQSYVKANPLPKGEKGETGPVGKAGIDGRDGSPGADGKHGIDGKDGARGEKGMDGANGRDAEVSYDDILKAVEDVHERIVAKYILDLERRGMDAVQRCLEKIIPAKDGKDGRDGKDGLSVEGLQREYVPESHEIRERWMAAGVEKELRYPAGGINAKGYWREGVQAKAGDAWTESGALWIAIRDTTDKPGLQSKDWTLGARAGRDGSHGRNGKDAQPVQLKSNA